MNTPPRTIIYIDSANLHRASRELGFDIDYKRFYNWLHQKYKFLEIYFFIGYLEKNKEYYELLTAYGYKLFFKETLLNRGFIKGNCDAELVLKVMEGFYTRVYDRCLIITGDGDFACTVEFLNKQNIPTILIGPNINKFSILLEKTASDILFLNTHYYKFSSKEAAVNEKTPIADASA